MTDREKAVAAYKAGLLNKKIVIKTDADLTPQGKRNARIVELRGIMGKVAKIRWYVSGRIYRQLDITETNIRLTQHWKAA